LGKPEELRAKFHISPVDEPYVRLPMKLLFLVEIEIERSALKI
jgi:hypothetical protein